jgi:lipopolysaccharide/colanic/teichoic acid biosynthesis glycosyltransferase
MVVEIRRINSRRSFSGLATLAWHLLGLVVLCIFGVITRELWGQDWLALLANGKTVNIYLVLLAYIVMAWVSRNLDTFAGMGALSMIFANGGLIYLGVLATIAITRVPYERSYVVLSFLLSVAWVWFAHQGLRRSRPRMGLVPGGFAAEVQKQPEVEWVLLDGSVPTQTLEGVVLDFHHLRQPRAAQLVSDMALRGIPIYHAAIAYEQITGRVALEHFSEQTWQALRLPLIYPIFKRLMDLLLVLLSLPLTLPLMLAVALLIRLDSPGPALFWQRRTGLRGKPFQMLKFRSMYQHVGDSGSPFVTPGDSRVTRMGRILRLLRLNELPQLWNVFRGEMSLIGPRPEQLILTERYQNTLPLYMQRYRVRPGLTGWAQTMQGYAASDKEIEIKLTFDLYYVKHLSLWLDLLIFWRTFSSLISGFGGR